MTKSTSNRYLSLDDLIRNVRNIYGQRRVQICHERQGIYRNLKIVLRVMQKYALISVARRKKFHYCSQYMHKYPNILNGDFTVKIPNRKRVTDISYIPTKEVTAIFQ